MTLGPNHKPNCSGELFYHSGGGYHRVRVCRCGAEDHDPETYPDLRYGFDRDPSPYELEADASIALLLSLLRDRRKGREPDPG